MRLLWYDAQGVIGGSVSTAGFPVAIDAGARRSKSATVLDLLRSYESVRQRVATRPPPRWLWWHRWRWRWCVGTEAFTIEHTRSTLEAVKRSSARTVALNKPSRGYSTEDVGQRVEQYISSLPTTRPRCAEGAHRRPHRARRTSPFVAVRTTSRRLSDSDGSGRGPGFRPPQRAHRTRRHQRLQHCESRRTRPCGRGLRAAVVVSTACLAAWLVLRPVANGLLHARALFDSEGEGSLHEREACTSCEHRRGVA